MRMPQIHISDQSMYSTNFNQSSNLCYFEENRRFTFSPVLSSQKIRLEETIVMFREEIALLRCPLPSNDKSYSSC